MKKIGFLVLFLLVFSCAKKDKAEKILVGTWDGVSMTIYDDDGSEVATEEWDVTLIFEDNKTFKMKYHGTGGISDGEWYLEDGGDVLVLDYNGGSKEKWDIVKLDRKKLIYKDKHHKFVYRKN